MYRKPGQPVSGAAASLPLPSVAQRSKGSGTQTEKYQIGHLHSREFRIALSEWDLPYEEHKGLLESVFVIKAGSPRDATKLVAFNHEAHAWMERIEAMRQQRNDEEQARRLRRVNRFRRVTFRKPLSELPAGA